MLRSPSEVQCRRIQILQVHLKLVRRLLYPNLTLHMYFAASSKANCEK